MKRNHALAGKESVDIRRKPETQRALGEGRHFYFAAWLHYKHPTPRIFGIG